MPRLLDRVPFLADASEVSFRGERIRVRANQILLWISLTEQYVKSPNPRAIPFPAILDTGFNHSFAIQQRHLNEWAGIRPDAMGSVSNLRDRGQRIPLHGANIWVHPNQPHRQTHSTEVSPQLIFAFHGIAVYPTSGGFPRLPLLGLRAIAENHLKLHISGDRREATLRTPLRWWPFW